MSEFVLKTDRLLLMLQTPAEALAQIEALSPEDRAEVSPAWLARVTACTEPNPWVHGFTMREAASGEAIGNCGFAAPPDPEGGVELA